MSATAPTLSVIIPTRNRRDLLREAIEAIWCQTQPAATFEIVVVDNCSSDGTEEMIDSMRAVSPCALVYHVMPDNRGPARSRNVGVSLARGALLAFTDSDCRPTPTWLERGLSHFGPGIGFVSGAVINKPEQRLRFFSRTTGEAREEHPTYSWSNTIYQREAFLAAGGTDESLCFADFRNRVVDCGDTDLAWRVKKMGYANKFDPEMVVHHHIETQTPINWLLELWRLFVVPALVARHPELRTRLLYRGVFFFKESLYFDLAVLGALAGWLMHPAFLLLVIPYAVALGKMMRPWFRWKRLPVHLAQAALLTARHFVVSAAFIYGSIKFRTLVL